MKSILLKLSLCILLGSTIVSCGCMKKCDAPANAISPDEAFKMQQDYLANQYEYISSGLATNYPGTGVEDSKEVWFSIEDIEQYICYAKKESLLQGKKLNGLRVYLAAKQVPTDIVPTSTVPRSTVFFVPTHKANEMKSPIGRTITPEGDDTESENKDTNGIKPLNMGDVGNGNYENTGG